jgi:hypothetical protein
MTAPRKNFLAEFQKALITKLAVRVMQHRSTAVAGVVTPP